MSDDINIKFPLKRGVKGAFETNRTTLDAVKDDLKILLLTNHGERPIHRTFGANLRSIMFDQGDFVLQKAADLITAAVEEWMPFVQIVSLEVKDETIDSTLHPNELNINISFRVGELEGALDQRIKN